MSRQMIYPDECYAIRGAVYEVYRELGSGFREEVYQQRLRLTGSKLGCSSIFAPIRKQLSNSGQANYSAFCSENHTRRIDHALTSFS